jgi:hypothetical protein
MAKTKIAINIKSSTANPVTADVGNRDVQGRIVSKSVQFPLFTNNRNAVWAGRQQLSKESYPLALISFPANRNVFRLEIGDCFKFSCAKYGITEMVCRVAQISEEGPESEIINIQAIQDIYSISNAITEYTEPGNYTITPPDYSELPFINQKVIEAPFAVSSMIGVLACASRATDYDLGFNLYMSSDGGSSYALLGTLDNIVPYGTLSGPYSGNTYTIDEEGIIIDFEKDEEDVITSTWPYILSGTENLALLGDEIISFLTVTPLTATQYQLENVIRGRFGTQKQDHVNGEPFYVITSALEVIANAEITAGASRKFKLVPFNVEEGGDISDATAIDLTITGLALTPYIPINFAANGSSFAARYDDDIVLTWSPRYRGKGAGIGIPGTVLAETTREGYFTIEVWVGGIKVRTVSAIDDVTFTFTEAMNLADNGSLASSVIFKIANYRTDGGNTFTSGQATVTCYKN